MIFSGAGRGFFFGFCSSDITDTLAYGPNELKIALLARSIFVKAWLGK
ncbi:hypothetical protein EJK55_1860 [Moraxella catarrhalis]|uniref:Uncharacterized protein n=1 Tax=Moraxella catarrhalis TaxID=480 RepID=A0A198X930_MORCA|nr:hypothetical protein EJK50_1446 [Moraxella catarrhalis]EKF83287.1 hypothetical protein MCRH_1402 [Moraxella catarrhalis RH4]AZQ92544.1 hypothetical protein EJK53_1457 [Moraxella catarrhalis]AZQ95556.1 hypothetical protein EJK48_1470 [Moraxella catarrhalis]OAV10968.1 hypothetical protein AO377_0766 [Moraxella catarrhalis]